MAVITTEGAGASSGSAILDAFSSSESPVSTSLTNMAHDYSEMQIYDTYNIPAKTSMALFECPSKRISVPGILVEPFQFNLESNWNNKALGALSDSPVASLVEGVSSLALGASFNQPIFNRRSWSGTSPFESSVKLRFIAQTDGLAEVYLPVINLAALLTPRLLAGSPGLEGALGIFALPGPSPLGGPLVDAITNIFNLHIPTDDFQGDSVTITIGKLVKVTNAYVTKLQGLFSKSLDKNGYPLAAEVVVSFSSMDSPYLVMPQDATSASVTPYVNNILMGSNSMPVGIASRAFVEAINLYTSFAHQVGTALSNSGINLGLPGVGTAPTPGEPTSGNPNFRIPHGTQP